VNYHIERKFEFTLVSYDSNLYQQDQYITRSFLKQKSIDLLAICRKRMRQK